MKNERRFVFDTNVIISAALIKNSVSRQAYDMACRDGMLYASRSIIAELQEKLSLEKFNKYISENERMLFLAAFVRDAVLVEPSKTITECRDPKDDKFLEVAAAIGADCIVSGDDD